MSQETGTENKILEAACTEFSQEGFAAARIDHIAKLAGVNKAMIYYHFKSKEDLYNSVLDHVFFQNKTEEDNSEIFPTVKEELESYICKFMKSMDNHGESRCTIIAREMVNRGATFQLLRDRYWVPHFEYLHQVIDRGIGSGEFKPTQPIGLIVYTIVTHIVHYKINEVTYRGAAIYDQLYPENYETKMESYLFELISFLLHSK